MSAINWSAGGIIALSLMVLSVHLAADTNEFSVYNIEWNGTSTLHRIIEDAGGSMVWDTSTLQALDNTTLIIIAPYPGFDSEDVVALREFIRRGNAIVIADDSGAANSLLIALSSGMRVIPANLSSFDREYNDPRMVRGVRSSNTTLLPDVTSIITNRAAVVEGGDPLITTTLLSWLDKDGNGRISPEEEIGRFTLIATEDLEGGLLMLVSDPSVVINAMGVQDSNSENLRFIQGMLGLRAHTALDLIHGRTGSAGPTTRLLQDLKKSSTVRIGVVVLCIIGIGLVFRRMRKRQQR